MAKIGRRSAAALAAGLLAAPALRAQAAFPNKPLRLIVPYPPGGVTDLMGRLAAEAMGRHLGQPVVVENRAGAGGSIGAKVAAQAEPDGHTLFLGTMATQGVNPVLYPDPGFDPRRDLVGVGMMADMPNVLICNPRRWDPANAQEAIARAKAEPGRLLFGSVGNGSSSHLSQVMLARLAGIEVVHVPYRGSSPAIAAMLAGELDLLFDASATSTSHIRGGAVKALAVTMNRRVAALPEVPTLEEAGVRGYHLSVWNGVFTQARVPAPVLARLQQAFDASMDQAMLERLKANFTEPLIIPAAELQDWLRRDAERWSTIARESGIRAD
ncbi:Bug family tripartite tricarboxylate transporter substrate binding protein [Roseicella aerolata]|uniref:Tripartite tricarboxylate transporter substrate binding protein n=1 Tax=Roseicella aerolata TaxID=2883479 RepID=A0A9X1IHR3_9PROT|nr:tripartite tricarboxylate transporter substrate-binding protein [Roseicella aerolata]MCB4824884.1 tripartite tricarboxylate transporter substrate binding protein [Roseicella aerolata]